MSTATSTPRQKERAEREADGSINMKPVENKLMTTFARFLPYLWPPVLHVRLLVMGALVFLVGSRLINMLVPIILGRSIDALTLQDMGMDTREIVAVAVPVGLILAYGAARLFTQIFGELRDGLFIVPTQHAIRTLALQTFRHLHGLSIRFHLNRQTGGLTTAINRGSKGIEFLLRFMLLNFVPTFIEILLVCTYFFFVFGWLYAVVTFVTLIGYIIYTIMVTEWRIKFRKEMNQKDEAANTKAIDSLLNFETVKYFSNEQHEASRYDSALKGYQSAAIKSQFSLTALNIGQGVIISVGMVLLMWMAANQVVAEQGVAGGFSVGDFVAINTFMLQLYLPLNFLGFAYREIRQALVDMEYMFNILEVNQEVKDAEDAPDLKIHGAEVAFKNIHFAYNPDRQILKGVDFKVPAGKTTAIVGPSGSGKSTIGRLLFRFYDAQQGAIEIDGQEVHDVAQESLREQIGIVPQDTVLFNDSIFYNIAYGRPGASRADVEEAAKLARVHDFITSLPEGYDTKVGERGLKLSGGERQRVSIARTILKKPKIMLFDEATSALDTETESTIQANLEEISADRTTLVIAHRLSTVVNADEIIVLADGQIAERGTHDQLLKIKNGVYAHMWELQAQEH